MASVDPKLYAPGTPFHNGYSARFGKPAADYIYAGVLQGRHVNDLIGDVQYGRGWNETTPAWREFVRQITTDPLAAPLESANNVIGNSVLSFLKNPWVVVAVAVFVWGWLGWPGLNSLKRKLA